MCNNFLNIHEGIFLHREVPLADSSQGYLCGSVERFWKAPQQWIVPNTLFDGEVRNSRVKHGFSNELNDICHSCCAAAIVDATPPTTPTTV